MGKGGTAVSERAAKKHPESKWPRRIQERLNATAPAISLTVGGAVVGGALTTTFSSSAQAIAGAVLGAAVGLSSYALARLDVRRKG